MPYWDVGRRGLQVQHQSDGTRALPCRRGGPGAAATRSTGAETPSYRSDHGVLEGVDRVERPTTAEDEVWEAVVDGENVRERTRAKASQSRPDRSGPASEDASSCGGAHEGQVNCAQERSGHDCVYELDKAAVVVTWLLSVFFQLR